MMMKKLLLAAVAVATLTASPAMARDHYDHRDGGGDALAGAVVGGIIGLIVGSQLHGDDRYDGYYNDRYDRYYDNRARRYYYVERRDGYYYDRRGGGDYRHGYENYNRYGWRNRDDRDHRRDYRRHR
jgi:hypothetical protein